MSSVARVRFYQKIEDINKYKSKNKLRAEMLNKQFLIYCKKEFEEFLVKLNNNQKNDNLEDIDKISNLIKFNKLEEAMNIIILIKERYGLCEVENSIIDILKENIRKNILEDEYKYFEHIFMELDEMKKNNDIDEEKLKNIENKALSLLNRLDIIYNYIDILKENKFEIDKFTFNRETQDFFIYSTKNNKYILDSHIKENEIEYKFDNYSGSDCLDDLNKILEIANEYYNQDVDIVDFKEAPISLQKDTVNDVIYGGNSK